MFGMLHCNRATIFLAINSSLNKFSYSSASVFENKKQLAALSAESSALTHERWWPGRHALHGSTGHLVAAIAATSLLLLHALLTAHRRRHWRRWHGRTWHRWHVHTCIRIDDVYLLASLLVINIRL